jgi:hypothetical protein
MFPDEKFVALMARVFDDHRSEDRKAETPEEYDRRRRDFAFHMSDWSNDLQGLMRIYNAPASVDLDEATTFLIGFLYHVVPHLNEAGRLLLDGVPDTLAQPAAPALAGSQPTPPEPRRA